MTSLLIALGISSPLILIFVWVVVNGLKENSSNDHPRI